MIKIHVISLCREKLFGIFSSGLFVLGVNTQSLWVGSIANDPKTRDVFVLLRFMYSRFNVNTYLCYSPLIPIHEVIHIHKKFVWVITSPLGRWPPEGTVAPRPPRELPGSDGKPDPPPEHRRAPMGEETQPFLIPHLVGSTLTKPRNTLPRLVLGGCKTTNFPHPLTKS